ncbi:helix-turn-helix domain-containing protein [Chloroflexota bacterium]
MTKHNFDTKLDISIIHAGGFFCHACLIDKSAEELSPDPRYCLGCYNFLVEEAKMSTRRCNVGWKPIVTSAGFIQGREQGEKIAQVSPDVRTIMSTLESKKSEVDIIQPVVISKEIRKRGPKPRSLPEDFIRQLASEGTGSKAIATRLKAEGVTVSYKTIQRVLSGERNQNSG